MTFFSETKQLPPDSLLQLITEFRNDPSPDKIDLGVGVYQDEHGKTPIFEAVELAQRRLQTDEDSKTYLGPLGWPGFADEVRKLVLGEVLEEKLAGRFAVLPTPGGSGALKSAGTLVQRLNPSAKIRLPDPTWANHKPIFLSCDLETVTYAYYDNEATSLDREKMYADLAAAQSGDIIVVHGNCHNPTGEDLSAEDWKFLTDLALEKGIVPFIDIAYQGLGQGFHEDMAHVRSLLESVPEAILCYSFSKNMGLYRERVGAALVMTENADMAERVQSNLNEIARRTYSMPPSYGAALAWYLLSDPDLNASWRKELEQLRKRVVSLRAQVTDALSSEFGDNRFQYITAQNGMFSRLPLTPEQINRFKTESSIYMAGDGRVNMCGFTPAKIARFTENMSSVLK
ncbi:aromatic amino acid transaminase [Parvularcula sp. IMCC14364]|uniref:amino acid aminotransferase n=1 Tax=Parvularcula sp. IMCC14364 TaxID=3067902 RepID=UPI0027407DC6|nr:aromatic amino acid transaminase [Parvularcula sp. IMCC14364]